MPKSKDNSKLEEDSLDIPIKSKEWKKKLDERLDKTFKDLEELDRKSSRELND